MAQPTNAVIVQRIDDMQISIERRLDKLNGAVESNTKFRLISIGALKVVGVLIGGGGIVFLFVR